jgi:hypothetical protein
LVDMLDSQSIVTLRNMALLEEHTCE